MRTTQSFLVLVLSTTLLATAVAGTYASGGTFVVKTQFGTLLDNGGVVCEGTDGDGVGGGCLLFPKTSPDGTTGARGGFVGVRDDAAGTNVAFQVCIDNNGDGICGGPQGRSRCFDQIFFSHNDEGRFFNPLGPLPTSFLPECGAGGFPGYVVLLCQGAHEANGSAHTHSLSSGRIALMSEGSGYGDFCGGNGGAGTPSGNVDTVAKAYVLR